MPAKGSGDPSEPPKPVKASRDFPDPADHPEALRIHPERKTFRTRPSPHPQTPAPPVLKPHIPQTSNLIRRIPKAWIQRPPHRAPPGSHRTAQPSSNCAARPQQHKHQHQRRQSTPGFRIRKSGVDKSRNLLECRVLRHTPFRAAYCFASIAESICRTGRAPLLPSNSIRLIAGDPHSKISMFTHLTPQARIIGSFGM